MKPIGLLTSQELSQLIPDENYLITALAQENLSAQPVIWNQKNNWSDYQAIIIRNPWDYFEHQELFFSTLQEISTQTKLFNSYPLVKWNLNKAYLFDLQKIGAHLAPTIRISGKENLLPLIQNSPYEDLVIKPLISAGAYLTYRFKKSHIPPDVLNLPVDHYEFMLQPFLPDILTEGEYSFIYLGGHFSHAIVKRPKSGDFRVQSEYGGSVDPYAPSESELKMTDFIHSILPEKPHYARIDLARFEGKLVIMEVELLEPELFFRTSPGSAKLLAQSIKASL